MMATIDLDPVIQICAVIGIVPAIIVSFLVCTYGFYSIIRDKDMEYIPLVLALSLGAGVITWGYIALLVITVPVTIFIASSYFIALKLNKYQISISKNNEDKTT